MKSVSWLPSNFRDMTGQIIRLESFLAAVMGVAWRHATDRERLDDDFDFEPVNVRVGSSSGSPKISEVFPAG